MWKQFEEDRTPRNGGLQPYRTDEGRFEAVYKKGRIGLPDSFMNLPDLVGRDHDDPLVQDFIRRYELVDFDQTDEARRLFEATPRDVSYEDIAKQLRQHKLWYVSDPVNFTVDLDLQAQIYGGPLSVVNVTVRPGFAGELPYGLQFGADVSSLEIGRLLDKGQLTNDGAISHNRTFVHHGFSISIGYTEPSNHLSYVAIGAVDPGDLARLRFYDGLDAQEANLVEDIDARLERCRSASPLQHWRQRMADGDTIFSETNIRLTEDEIDALFASIQEATKQRSPRRIIDALKNTIENLNRLNREHGDFIETTEREELGAFLQDVLRATGLRFEDGFDVTLEWRDW
ncbi:hypothetical protein M2272_003210 [Mycobacterium frederiksbergense]|uniref:DUF932 domain-containing protein n=1 Tax=Mycolicibacterium frederiksbergense TaxID=117567 RepID=A0ABT6L0U3_9MYCO|nr:hypothetical protein [Mycolicibacterium frederiksbergense]MDH6196567.1 hypothetical protein [Mycolicibacterium frederiksbergense]